MNRIRRSFVVLCLSVACIASAGQDGIVLKRILTEGDVDTYTMTTNSDQTIALPGGAGDQNIGSKIEATYVIKTGKVDAEKGSAEAEVTTTLTKITMDSPMGGMGTDDLVNKPVVIKGTIDTRGRILMPPAKGSNPFLSGAMSVGSSTMGIELPDHAVKVGDSWTVMMPKNVMLGDAEHKLTATLTGEKEVEGKTVYVVKLVGDLNVDVDLSKTMGEQSAMLNGQKLLMKGKIHLESEGTVDKATGKTLTLSSKTKTDQQMEMPDMGLTMNTTGTATTLITLKQ